MIDRYVMTRENMVSCANNATSAVMREMSLQMIDMDDRAAQLEAERDEARAKLALVKAEAEYWFTQYKLATSNTVSMEAIP